VSQTLLAASCAVPIVLLVQPLDQPNPLFRHLYEVRNTTGECGLCQFLARHRVNPQPHYQTCLFDKDW
jgi:hypothetical protein